MAADDHASPMARESTAIRVEYPLPRSGRASSTRDGIRASTWVLPSRRAAPSERAVLGWTRPPASTRCNDGHDAPAHGRGRAASGFHERSFRQHAGVQVAPQRDQQLARDGDDADPPLPRAAGCEARPTPASERTGRLSTDPARGEFDGGGPEPLMRFTWRVRSRSRVKSSRCRCRRTSFSMLGTCGTLQMPRSPPGAAAATGRVRWRRVGRTWRGALADSARCSPSRRPRCCGRAR